MKHALLALFAMLILGGCHWIQDPRSPEVAAATQTASAQLIPPLPAVTPEVIPADEVGEVLPEPTPVPPCEIVKGNISSSTGEKIYHLPGQANYNQVKIDESKGEAFFCDEQSAIDAGFRKATR